MKRMKGGYKLTGSLVPQGEGRFLVTGVDLPHELANRVTHVGVNIISPFTSEKTYVKVAVQYSTPAPIENWLYFACQLNTIQNVLGTICEGIFSFISTLDSNNNKIIQARILLENFSTRLSSTASNTEVINENDGYTRWGNIPYLIAYYINGLFVGVTDIDFYIED